MSVRLSSRFEVIFDQYRCSAAPNSERERIWQPNASLKREIEVRFIAECKDATRVELEHQHLDRYGARRDEMRDLIEGRRYSMRAGSAIPKVRRSVGG